jgi:antitoxin component YwqK of YwqJK toxin-antitoxin module
MSILQKLLSLFLLLVVVSCSEQAKEVTVNAEPIQTVDTLLIAHSTKKFVDYTDSINCIDQHGRKQGTWIYEDPTVAWEVKVQYVNDTLHGMWTKYSRSFSDTGHFVNGLQQGPRSHYYDRKLKNTYSQVAYLSMMKDDTVIWYMYPASDFGKIIPIKGLGVYQDSVRVTAPYKNGNVAYDGLFIKYEAIGIHNSYYPNGKQYQSIDYDNNLLTEYDSLMNIKSEFQFDDTLNAAKINQSFYLFSKYIAEDKIKRVSK